MSKEIHVSKTGDDKNEGSYKNPFLTISHAAQIANAGDTVTVHAGTYNEWVSPKNGGSSDDCRITYQAAADEDVVIKGSEIIENWTKTDDGIWTASVPNTLFGDFNPYVEQICGDWFEPDGRKHHRGEVYINGKSLFEAATLEDVKSPPYFEKARDYKWSKHTWISEVTDKETTFYVNFQDLNPNDSLVEINVRQFCFWPKETGRNYITVRGFTMKHAATNWAPPTAEQEGMIGPNWSKGWIIEHNTLSDSKCSAISLGKERTTGHNEWSDLKFKHGTQRERDVIFRALQIGWNKENIGSHIVRNNTIFDCEQTGICGHLGCVFSTIENNHIYNIHAKRLFRGAEVGGIKLHAPLDTVIKGNHIHNADRGMWMDWQTQGTRITGNVLYDNDTDDFFIEVCHGPYLVDNNIMLSDVNCRDMSQGGAYAHNLFMGKAVTQPVKNRFTPYHLPHKTDVMGLMTIQGGDTRYYNNIFINPEDKEPRIINGKAEKVAEGAFVGKVPKDIPAGTHIYNECPNKGENWYGDDKMLTAFDQHRFPVHMISNVYFNGAKAYHKEENALQDTAYLPSVQIRENNGSLSLKITLNDSLIKQSCPTVTTELMGTTIQTESLFEQPDGNPYVLDKDMLGNQRSKNPSAGPIENLKEGESILELPLPA